MNEINSIVNFIDLLIQCFDELPDYEIGPVDEVDMNIEKLNEV